MTYLPCFECNDPNGLWRMTGEYLCSACWLSGNPHLKRFDIDNSLRARKQVWLEWVAEQKIPHDPTKFIKKEAVSR